MGHQYVKKKKKERVVLVGLMLKGQDEDDLFEFLDELAFLADTAGAKTVSKFYQKLDAPNPKYFMGKGKMEEVKAYVEEHDIDTVIFDDELTPSQLRNLEKMFQCKILDRSNLILDIFAKRARTAHAKTQVELAQYQYLLPRLTRMWTHLDRTKGGIGMRGPGETEIETDRRIIRDKISLLKKKLEKIDKQKYTQRKSRGQFVRAALVGYTNVGKSTIMNLLSKSEVFAENKLFATLDTTVRKVVIKNLPFLLSDTVGFIRKLPHHLIESFKSTLDEVREADVLIHVVDVSHPKFEDHYKVVAETLNDLGAADKPLIIVFNKIDAIPLFDFEGQEEHKQEQIPITLNELKKTWMSKGDHPCVFISAVKKENIEELREVLYNELRKIHMRIYPHKLLY